MNTNACSTFFRTHSGHLFIDHLKHLGAKEMENISRQTSYQNNLNKSRDNFYNRTYDIMSSSLLLGMHRRFFERYENQSFIIHFRTIDRLLTVQVSVFKDQIQVHTRFGMPLSLSRYYGLSLSHAPESHTLTHLSRSREDRITVSSRIQIHRVSLPLLLRLKAIPTVYFSIIEKRIMHQLERLSNEEICLSEEIKRDLTDEGARALLCFLV